MKKNRSTLKDYFKKGAIPTESNFADLIDSMLNQDEDGIAKLPNDPLKITAIGVDEALVNFYRIEKNEEKLSWQMKQKTGNASGLSINDSAANRLFIENGTGNVGVGTTTPKQNLDVRGRINVENGVIQRGGAAVTATSDLGLYSQVDKNYIRLVTTNAPIRFYTDSGMGTNAEVSIEPGAVNMWGKVGIGTASPGTYKLRVEGGAISTNNNLHTQRGRLAFSNTADDPNHTIYNNNGNIDAEGAWDGMKMNVYAGLDVRVGNVSTKSQVSALRIESTGNVGIGVTPTANVKLEVVGTVNIHDGSGVGARNGNMSSGSLTIGSINKDYGGGTGWSTNTAALLLEAKDNTEIVVHDSGNRLTSLMYFEGGGSNRITIGRDMSWGALSSLILNGNIGIGTTTTDTYKLNVSGTVLFTGNYLYANAESAGRLRVGAAWGIPGLYSGDDGAKDLVLGVPSGRKVYIGTSTGDMSVEGGTGNTYIKGKLQVDGAQNLIRVKTFTLAVQTGVKDRPNSWSVDYTDQKFTEVYTVFACLQGYSLWANDANFGSWGHVQSNEAIPQHTFVKVTSSNLKTAGGTAYCSESNGNGEPDNTVLFTVVVMGRV